MFSPKAHMICSDLNFQEAPSCTPKNDKIQPAFNPIPLSAYIHEQFHPRKVEIKVVQNIFKEEDSNEIKKDSTEDISFTYEHDPCPGPKSLFVVSKSSGEATQKIFHHYSDQEITEFNTNPKLKKIHSTYHLKRKFTTKFQNDIKNTLNKLISTINMKNSEFKLPFVAQNTKGFREDVKIESLHKIKDLTIAKYIAEDTQVAGRSLNWDNYSLNEKVSQLYSSQGDNQLIKELYDLLNNKVIYDYYSEFIISSRYKKCFEKDLQKYKEKLNELNFSKSKADIYIGIFREKYTGISKNYFSL